MKFNKGDIVRLKSGVMEDWKEIGVWYPTFSGDHVVSHYEGGTVYFESGHGVHNEDALEMVRMSFNVLPFDVKSQPKNCCITYEPTREDR